MNADTLPRTGRHVPDWLAAPLLILGMVLMLFTLPVTLPVALLFGLRAEYALRAAATHTPCVRCGLFLGRFAPEAADAAHIAALAEMQRQYPHHRVNVLRRADARCTSCGADYAWDKANRALRPVPDDAPA